jgi:hypothetical protein
MDKQTVINALALLGRKAEARGIAPEIAIYGGTVMMLAYRLREGTQDVDAVFRPRENLQPLIAEVAAELNLAPDWLNDNVSQFAPNAGPARRRISRSKSWSVCRGSVFPGLPLARCSR